MEHFFVDVKKLLAEAGQEQLFKSELTLEPFLLGEETVKFKEPVAVNFVLRNVGEGILIEGKVKAVLVLHCSRCLTLFSLPLTTKVRELAVVNKAERDDVFAIENGKIDLVPIIYENLILELPVKRLCRPDCAGLCSVCGKNLNEEPHTHKKEVFDERLAKLKDFFKKS
jgi:uncharacterized protein